MSKIAEQKALEAYPIAYYRNGGGIDDANAFNRAVYEEGYDQATQDFMEKAEMYLRYRVYYNTHPNNINVAIEQFKNYMQDEM